jgi:hypothetical protein
LEKICRIRVPAQALPGAKDLPLLLKTIAGIASSARFGADNGEIAGPGG